MNLTGISATVLLALTVSSGFGSEQHLLSDGSPRFTNRLSQESSPYLQQHAHNPVDWYPWSDEAFLAAREQGKPVLLSIGYSTCHWCHVMEDESFENIEIATFLNENYIAIKVDREERPDIDRAYMAAVEAFSGSGGWPMTVWLTPEREPFFGSTYLPPYDGDRGVQHGFLSRLRSLSVAWNENRDQVDRISAQLSAAVRSRLVPPAGTDLPDDGVLDRAFAAYAQAYDAENGGLKTLPKFASHLPTRFLMRYHLRTGNVDALQMAVLTLRKMARGGMFDQIGGGFHRYATDLAWKIPHFEKMLYDNALLAMTYLEAYQLTGDEDLVSVCREILLYASRDMRSPLGAFYSATDADSVSSTGARVEGGFYTWTAEEVDAALDSSSLDLGRTYYGIDDEGDLDGRNVLHIATVPDGPARQDQSVERVKERLYQAREKRSAPFMDTKILTAWNSLMISAFARASLYLGDDEYLTIASDAADFILRHVSQDGRLMRSSLNGASSGTAFADDYAYTVQAMLDLYQASGEIGWFEHAIRLQQIMTEEFGDGDGGAFFFSPISSEVALAREKPSFDNTMPSANSVAVLNLLRFYEFTSNDDYRVQANAAIRYLNATLSRAPAAAPDLLQSLDFFLDDAKAIVIVTAGDRSDALPFLQVLGATFLPNHVVTVVQQGAQVERHAELIPIVEAKRAMGGKTTAYVCIHGICDLPTTDTAVFAEQIGAKGL
jgi:uncharacterized protein YyaL (SSP411 family)